MFDSDLVMGVCLLCLFVFCVFCKYIYYGVFLCEIKRDNFKKFIEEYNVVFSVEKELFEKCFGKW